jgi:hypothetical protein
MWFSVSNRALGYCIFQNDFLNIDEKDLKSWLQNGAETIAFHQP